MTLISEPDFDVDDPDPNDETDAWDAAEAEDQFEADGPHEHAEDHMTDVIDDQPTVGQPAGAAPAGERPTFWSTRQIAAVTQRVLAVFVVLGLLGYGLGAMRGTSHVARAEFVYTLDESVPDSFLREDRRLLTQVVTFESEAVLTPVSAQFGLTVDELRAKIDVQTLNLSEVLRLDVTDSSPDMALALNRAVLDRYLQVIADAEPAGNGEELAERRAEVTAALETADRTSRSLLEDRQQDAALQVRADSLNRQIDRRSAQIDRLQSSLDDALARGIASSRANLSDELEEAETALAELEAELADVAATRAALETSTTAEPALLREIDRLEAMLQTIDEELAERELGPLVASPIRELSEPILLERPVHFFGLQGMAIGLMVAIPIAALVGYRTRQRQIWFD